jgi:hypothetical protein
LHPSLGRESLRTTLYGDALRFIVDRPVTHDVSATADAMLLAVCNFRGAGTVDALGVEEPIVASAILGEGNRRSPTTREELLKDVLKHSAQVTEDFVSALLVDDAGTINGLVRGALQRLSASSTLNGAWRSTWTCGTGVPYRPLRVKRVGKSGDEAGALEHVPYPTAIGASSAAGPDGIAVFSQAEHPEGTRLVVMWGVSTVRSLSSKQSSDIRGHYMLLRLNKLFHENRGKSDENLPDAYADAHAKIQRLLQKSLVLRLVVAPLAKWNGKAEHGEEELVKAEAGGNHLRVVVDSSSWKELMPALSGAVAALRKRK